MLETDILTQYKCLFAIAQRRKRVLSSRRRRCFYASLSFVGSIFLFCAALILLFFPCVYLTSHLSSMFALNAVPANATTFQTVEPHVLDAFSATRIRQYGTLTVPRVCDAALCDTFELAVFDSNNDSNSFSSSSSSFYMHILDQAPDTLQWYCCWQKSPGIYGHPLVVLEFTAAHEESPCFVSSERNVLMRDLGFQFCLKYRRPIFHVPCWIPRRSLTPRQLRRLGSKKWRRRRERFLKNFSDVLFLISLQIYTFSSWLARFAFWLAQLLYLCLHIGLCGAVFILTAVICSQNPAQFTRAFGYTGRIRANRGRMKIFRNIFQPAVWFHQYCEAWAALKMYCGYPEENFHDVLFLIPLQIYTFVCWLARFASWLAQLLYLCLRVGLYGTVFNLTAVICSQNPARFTRAFGYTGRVRANLGRMKIFRNIFQPELRFHQYCKAWAALKTYCGYLGAEAYSNCVVDAIALGLFYLDPVRYFTISSTRDHLNRNMKSLLNK